MAHSFLPDARHCCRVKDLLSHALVLCVLEEPPDILNHNLEGKKSWLPGHYIFISFEADSDIFKMVVHTILDDHLCCSSNVFHLSDYIHTSSTVVFKYNCLIESLKNISKHIVNTILYCLLIASVVPANKLCVCANRK